MKRFNVTSRSRREPTDTKRRAQLLAEFERSELSAAAFARQHGLHYTTFCGWRHRQAKAKPSPGFVQVELSAEAAPNELVIELGGAARLRLRSGDQIDLAAHLLHRLNLSASC